MYRDQKHHVPIATIRCYAAIFGFSRLLDQLIGDGENTRRYIDAERPRRLQIDDELERGRLLWVDAVRSRPLTAVAGCKKLVPHRTFSFIFVR
jgi:hypothetical protein